MNTQFDENSICENVMLQEKRRLCVYQSQASSAFKKKEKSSNRTSEYNVPIRSPGAAKSYFWWWKYLYI